MSDIKDKVRLEDATQRSQLYKVPMMKMPVVILWYITH
jgi:hypothetical protein